jgi:hypothetical protein
LCLGYRSQSLIVIVHETTLEEGRHGCPGQILAKLATHGIREFFDVQAI